MKRPLLKSLAAIVTIAGLLTTLSSCQKNAAAEKFVGTYTGIITIGQSGYVLDTLRIIVGSSSNSLTLSDRIIGGIMLGTISNTNLTIPPQTDVSSASGPTPIAGTGNLSKDTLTINISQTILGNTFYYVFTGTK